MVAVLIHSAPADRNLRHAFKVCFPPTSVTKDELSGVALFRDCILIKILNAPEKITLCVCSVGNHVMHKVHPKENRQYVLGEWFGIYLDVSSSKDFPSFSTLFSRLTGFQRLN